MVGDDAQSIYGFRAATVRNILDFPQQFSVPAHVVTLDRNYRSTKPILDASNAVIGLAAERFTKNLWTERMGSTKPALITVKDEADQAKDKLGKLMSSNINQGLTEMVAFTSTRMEKHYAEAHPIGAAVDKGVKQAKDFGNKTIEDAKDGRMDVTTIVIIIVVGLLGFWILIGLVRAFTRPRMNAGAYGTPPPPGMGRGGMVPPPPPGYGQPYGGQPYGGQPMGYPPQQAGGMGFMGSLMTGMLGAAAGNFMYDRFFRGGQSHDYGSSAANAGGGYGGGSTGGSQGDPGTGYAGGGDYDQADTSAPAGTSGGADYDQDLTGGSGGGDFGGGGNTGGDFGGGGGDVGGGDFGGSGGDFGGGGGGDFGGGGGGDFSGGGDLGGGGGDY